MAYPSTPVLQTFLPTLRRVVSSFLAHVRHARVGRPRSIHHARVASRRIREILPALTADNAADVRELRRAVRRLARALGRVRELDVMLELLHKDPAVDAWPRDMRAVVIHQLQTDRAERLERLSKRLSRRGVTPVGRGLRALTREAANPSHRVALEGGIATRRRARAGQLADALEHAGTLYVPSALHAVRIATKKLRYSLEWTKAVTGPVVAPQISELRAAQELLGELQDLYTLQSHLRRIAALDGIDRAMVRALHSSSGRLDAALRERHAHFLKVAPRLLALAQDLGRKTPLAWLRRRPARVTLERGPQATGVRQAAP